jgi:hypothetical protein
MTEAPYTKREQDLFRAENKQQHETVMAYLQKIEQAATLNNKVVENLCDIVSKNSGGITQLWDANKELKKQMEANSKATKIIDEIGTTWKWGKIVITSVITVLLAIIAIKKIITGGVHDGLQALKNIIF